MKQRLEAIERIKAEIAKPLANEDYERGLSDFFNPWEIFPCFYGSYSSDFDEMAILVLSNILANKWGGDSGEGLAHEMFREVLCTGFLCDYGTSPRGCFPEREFAEVLPTFIDKWEEYSHREWDS